MIILQLIDSLNSGGAERMCVNIASVLHENGNEVQICATRKGGPLEKVIPTGIKSYILNKRNSIDIFAFREFIKILRTEKIDVIHAHSSSLFWAVSSKFFIKKIKVIWHDHLGNRINDHKNNFLYKFISPKIDAIITVNQVLTKWSLRNMKVPPTRIKHINNFPRLREVSNHRDPNYFTIVCLANLRPQKSQETLIRAIWILRKEELHKKLRVLFVGDYSEDEYFFRLKDLINEFDLEGVISLTGSVEDTASLLACSDCGVLSSVSEGLPVSLLEYGLAGLPVVVTNVGQCAEVVGKGKFGRIVPPGDSEALAKELSWIMQNQGSAFQMGIAFRNHVNKEYSPGQFLTQYQDLLTEILQNDQLHY